MNTEREAKGYDAKELLGIVQRRNGKSKGRKLLFSSTHGKPIKPHLKDEMLSCIRIAKANYAARSL